MTLKKSALSIAVAGALGVAAAPALAGDTGGYGRLDVGLLMTDNPDEEDTSGEVATDGTNLDVNGVNSRFGWKGTEDLGNGMMAEYRYEFRVLADEATIVTGNRLSYVGLKGDVAGVRIGRQWSAFFNHIGTYLDPTLFTGMGTNTSPYRQSDIVKVHGSAGVASWEADLIFDGGAESPSNEENVDSVQVGATFDLGAANVSVAYHQATKGGIPVAGDDNEDASQIGLAGSFGIGKGITLRAGLIQSDDGSDENTTELGINASIDAGGGLNFLVGINSLTDDDEDLSLLGGSAGKSISSVMLGAYKHMSKRTRVYGELLALSPDTGDSTNVLYVGIRHDY